MNKKLFFTFSFYGINVYISEIKSNKNEQNSSRTPMLHKHSCFEIILLDSEGENSFKIVPPLLEHVAINVNKNLFQFYLNQIQKIVTNF